MQSEVVTRSGGYALIVPAGDVESVAAQAGLEPDGYFWEGVIRVLVQQQAPDLKVRFTFDSDDSACVAEARDRATLDSIAALLADLVADPKRFARILSQRNPAEFLD